MSKVIVLIFSLIFQLTYLGAQENTLPWISNIDNGNLRNTIITIYSEANVSVSDSSSYQTRSFFWDAQRAAFQLIYPDNMTTLGIEGKYYWQHNGSIESEGPLFLEDFVLGHQLHAQILFFDRIHKQIKSNQIDNFQGHTCSSIESEKNGTKMKAYCDENGSLLGMEIIPESAPPIVMTYDDWKMYEGFNLPFTIVIDDGMRVFTYRYTKLHFNESSLDEFRLDENFLTDEQKLLRLHRVGMDDHLRESVEGLRKIRSDSIIIVSRGEIYTMDTIAFDTGMSEIMNSRNHFTYDDLIRPIVKISDDGTLGWVIVQVSVDGIMLNKEEKETGPLNFVSAWIELYEKKNGKWQMVGNVSNFQN